MDGRGLDLLVMPGLAFDAQCNRLGHGKGYYDNFYARLEAWCTSNGETFPTTIALALSAQIISHVPTQEHDRRPDCVVTAYQEYRH
jgi:5-formyltetrahydrofolate cyclo-ligase